MKQFYPLWLYAVVLTAVAAGGAESFIDKQQQWTDANARISSLAATLDDFLVYSFNAKRFERIARTINRLHDQHRLTGVAICAFEPGSRRLSVASRGYPASFVWEPLCQRDSIRKMALSSGPVRERIWSARASAMMPPERDVTPGAPGGGLIQYLAYRPDASAATPPLAIIIARDISYLHATWLRSFLRAFLVTLFLGIALLILVTTQMRRWLQGNIRIFHRALLSLIAGRKPAALPFIRRSGELSSLKPISDDIDQLARILSMRPHRSSSERGGLVPQLSHSIAHEDLVIIANREPYIHQWVQAASPAPMTDGSGALALAGTGPSRIQVVRPASGLVTALEPILRQCGGLWIAHGGGSADFDVTDENQEARVPPEHPTYTLRRVRLTKEEENGYYYGFSNEGLWPLCHLAHTRPTFRLGDWQQYERVNHRFTEAIPEAALRQDTLFLIQDYHFALLPRMLQERASGYQRPRIGLFWHIPWPNPEAFGICPWAQELLEGMLGADILGFHTQYHCNNFLETCNRYLEARIDYERFSVTRGDHETLVRAFPIGIDTSAVRKLSEPERDELKARYGISAREVAVGVDRLDYTKGIIERIEAVERFLEKYPEKIGVFSLVQMGSPSRTHIPAYRAFQEQLDGLVERINRKFSRADSPVGYRPVLFLPHHHEWADIQYFYQLGDVCMVTSLHDGMNLVAKEYVWCQRPERGALVLSKFTGASRELTEAFIVNPYSIEEMADALHAALSLSPDEKARRMNAMREKVRQRNAYRWASELIEALIRKEDDARAPRKAPGPPGRSRSARRFGIRNRS